MAAAATAAEQQQHRQMDEEWERKTRPVKEAPRVNSVFFRKDYAAACPQQHAAYLRCMQKVGMFSIDPCRAECDAFEACKQRARRANTPAGAEQGPAVPLSTKLWEDVQRDPVVLAIKLHWQDMMSQLGCGSSSSSDSSSSSSSNSSSSHSEEGNS